MVPVPAVKLIVTELVDALTNVNAVGAVGAGAVVVTLTADDELESPAEFLAINDIEYVVPEVNPVIVMGDAVPVVDPLLGV